MFNPKQLGLCVALCALISACGSDSSDQDSAHSSAQASSQDHSSESPASSAQSQSSAPTLPEVPRTEFDHQLEWDFSAALNALEAGVVADDGTDQTDALNDAIHQVYEDPSLDTLYIPEGVYWVATNLRLRAGVNIIGDGIGKTILLRNNAAGYLVSAARDPDLENAVVAKLTLHNPVRTLLLQNVSNLELREVEFHGGLVRFEGSSHITIDNSLFLENQGKAGYSSDDCEYMTLTNNYFHSIEDGSINLSRHQHSYVAYNTITADSVIYSGYAGIRLPNDAHHNIVEHNTITNHGRGLFVLSSSTHNTLRHNTVNTTAYQAVFVESSDNLLEDNTIINAGDEAFLVQDAVAGSSPTPSLASRNQIRNNIVIDTRAMGGERNVGLRVYGSSNQVSDNQVSTRFGRTCKQIGAGNTDEDNLCAEQVPVCGVGTPHATVTGSEGGYQVNGSDAGSDYAAAITAALNSLTAERTSAERVTVHASGSLGSSAIHLPSNTIFEVCGSMEVGAAGNGGSIRAIGVNNVSIPHLTMTGSPYFGLQFGDVHQLHLGNLDLRFSGGLGIRFDRDRPGSTQVRMDHVYVSGTNNHGVETWNVDGLEIGTVIARNTGYSGLLLNNTRNATIGLVDGDNTGTGTGYATLRFANTNGRIGDAYPTNIVVDQVISRGGGRGIFCVSNSGGVRINNIDLANNGNNAILLENCHNVDIRAGTINGGGEVRLAARSEFPNNSDIRIANLSVTNTNVRENPCGNNIIWSNVTVQGGSYSVCN